MEKVVIASIFLFLKFQVRSLQISRPDGQIHHWRESQKLRHKMDHVQRNRLQRPTLRTVDSQCEQHQNRKIPVREPGPSVIPDKRRRNRIAHGDLRQRA